MRPGLLKKGRKRNRVALTGDSAGDGEREKDDFYATPEWVTHALLDTIAVPHAVWEPAAGEGHIARVLIARGHDVRSTDLVDRGWCAGRIDFLMEISRQRRAIVTNPPFKLAEAFAAHALALEAPLVAMLLKLSFLQGGSRTPWLFASGLSEMLVVPKRITFIAGAGRAAYKSNFADGYGWFIWRSGHAGPVTIRAAVLDERRFADGDA